MAVLNTHIRRIPVSAARAGALLDTLAGPGDVLWPSDSWPPLVLDRPLSTGAAGGHGVVRYTVQGYQPGRWLNCRFDRVFGTAGVEGFHEFLVLDAGNDETLLVHQLAARLSGRFRLIWPLAVRWLHDALIEDLLDHAEYELTGSVRTPARWNGYVRLLRAALGRAGTSTPRVAAHAV
ncbi:hypothetical protein [Nocardia miyunensis]|uniref:hypothetical protein n=1 Tax=Nocardia miyunensis TaxID=282684 RepID=UPI0008336130|nr:hypothetical protein [Nocardia miyunensis]